ncbi:ABC-2 type transport system permease protein [Nonomuraea solani]|uniref:ABC-2 type transport system permease protein n=1 Tax=Nonomuraea solani TaxID=1144553 RepID=A0A1H6EU91_9ACTN|nr:ABC transporter permease [Nonomuraea solani]SEH01427.1 ABC-2 type transport system permease protein [Nonomuraea solani]
MTTCALKAGLRRGLIELRQSFTNGAELFSHLFWPLLMLAALWFMRDREFGATGFTLGALALPSILGMNLSFGMISMSQQLTAEREDGTLLRAKATPNGMAGYLVGKIVSVSGGLLADLAIFLVPALFVIGGLTLGPGLVWVVLLGLTATLPIGAILGSLFTSSRSQGIVQVLALAMIAISGIFYPITALPGWLQVVGQVFPVYWLGLGMRSALLPAEAASVEIGESWRQVETLGVLGAWVVFGLAVAPIVLRGMARRESGSSVAARRERALQRVG